MPAFDPESGRILWVVVLLIAPNLLAITTSAVALWKATHQPPPKLAATEEIVRPLIAEALIPIRREIDHLHGDVMGVRAETERALSAGEKCFNDILHAIGKLEGKFELLARISIPGEAPHA